MKSASSSALWDCRNRDLHNSSKTNKTNANMNHDNETDANMSNYKSMLRASTLDNIISTTVARNSTNIDDFYNISVLKVALKFGKDTTQHNKPKLSQQVAIENQDTATKEDEQTTEATNTKICLSERLSARIVKEAQTDKYYNNRGKILWKFIQENRDLVLQTRHDIDIILHKKHRYYSQVPTVTQIFTKLNQRRISRMNLVQKRIYYFARNIEYKASALKMLVQKQMLARKAKLQRVVDNRSTQSNSMNKIIDIARTDSNSRKQEDLIYLLNWIENHIKKTGVIQNYLSKCSTQQKLQFVSKIQYNIYEPGEAIVRQNEIGDSYHILVSGETHVYVNDMLSRYTHIVANEKANNDTYLECGVGTKVDTIHVGSDFGEYSLITEKPRSSSVLCYPNGVCETLIITRSVFEDALMEHASKLIDALIVDLKKFYVLDPNKISQSMIDEVFTWPKEKKLKYRNSYETKLKQLFQYFQRCELKKGALLQKQNCFSDNVYLIMNGIVSEYVQYTNKDLKIESKIIENDLKTEKKLNDFGLGTLNHKLIGLDFTRKNIEDLSFIFYQFNKLKLQDSTKNSMKIKKLFIGNMDSSSNVIIGGYNALIQQKPLTTIDVLSDSCDVISIDKQHFRVILDVIAHNKLKEIGTLQNDYLKHEKLVSNKNVVRHVTNLVFETDKERLSSVKNDIASKIHESDYFCHHGFIHSRIHDFAKSGYLRGSKLVTTRKKRQSNNSKLSLLQQKHSHSVANAMQILSQNTQGSDNSTQDNTTNRVVRDIKILQDCLTVGVGLPISDSDDYKTRLSNQESVNVNFVDNNITNSTIHDSYNNDTGNNFKGKQNGHPLIATLDLEKVKEQMNPTDNLISELQHSLSQRTLTSARVDNFVNYANIKYSASHRNLAGQSRKRQHNKLRKKNKLRCHSARLANSYSMSKKSDTPIIVQSARSRMRPTVTQTYKQSMDGIATVHTLYKDEYNECDINKKYTLILGTSHQTISTDNQSTRSLTLKNSDSVPMEISSYQHDIPQSMKFRIERTLERKPSNNSKLSAKKTQSVGIKGIQSSYNKLHRKYTRHMLEYSIYPKIQVKYDTTDKMTLCFDYK